MFGSFIEIVSVRDASPGGNFVMSELSEDGEDSIILCLEDGGETFMPCPRSEDGEEHANDKNLGQDDYGRSEIGDEEGRNNSNVADSNEHGDENKSEHSEDGSVISSVMLDAEEVDWEHEFKQLSPVRTLSTCHTRRVGELAARTDDALCHLGRCIRVHHRQCVKYGGPLQNGDGAYKFNLEINNEAGVAFAYGTSVTDSVRNRLRENNIGMSEYTTVCTILEGVCSVLMVQSNILEYFYRFRNQWHELTNTILKRARRQYDCFEDCLNWVMNKLRILPSKHSWVCNVWNSLNKVSPLSWLIRLGVWAWQSVTSTASFSDAFAVTAKGGARCTGSRMASNLLLALTNDLKTILTTRISFIFQCTPAQISHVCFCTKRLYGIGSVVQLSCASSHRLHKKCYHDWAEATTSTALPTSCPYCREAPVKIVSTLRY